jgi:hypothetical protein
LVAGLIWLFGFAGWFHSFLLPNNPVGRWMIWTMIPFDLMDIIDPPVVAGTAPWSWFFLFQRLPFLLVAGLIWIGAWGAGSICLRWMKADLAGLERFFFACSLGLSIVSLATLLIGVCGRLSQWLMAFVILLGPSLEIIYRFRAEQIPIKTDQRHPRPVMSPWSWLLIFVGLAPFVVVQLLGAMSPQIDFDVVEYHLGGPKEWFQLGRISRLPHNVYTNFPFLSEMLLLTGMVLYGDWQWGALAGQAAIAGFIPLTALGLLAAGQRWFSEKSGQFAALIYLTSPWTYRISIIAYAEGSLSCYLLASFYAAMIFRQTFDCSQASSETRRMSIAFLTGAMSGSAMACKYTGMLSVVIPVGIFLFWTMAREVLVYHNRRFWIPTSLFVLGLMLTVGPWLAKNAINTGNPVYPLAVRMFGGVDRDEEIDSKWRNGHAAKHYEDWSKRLSDLPVKLADVAANNDWHSPLMFGLAPLSLFLFRRPQNPNQTWRTAILAFAWAYILWQFATWWLFTHHIDRFYVPMFSVVALLAGAGACWPMEFPPHTGFSRNLRIWQLCLWPVIVASILYNADVMLHLGGFNAGRMDLIAARDIATPGRIRWLNEQFESGRLPANTKVLCVGEAQLFHARYPYLYNTVFDHSLFERICVKPDSKDHELRSNEDIRAELRRLGITHIDVNWAEIQRYRAPGSYGYTSFVQPELFAELQRLRLLGPSLYTTTAEGKAMSITGQFFPVID